MKRVSMVPALLAGLLILAACASNEARWERAGATERDLDSDIYWCTRVEREQFYKHNQADTTRGREARRYIDAQCMRERGWRRVEAE